MYKYYTKLLKVLLNTDDITLEQLKSVDKLYRFKQTDLQTLPRVKEIIGILKSLQYDISSIVDFGSQRGALLFPLLDLFPNLNFTAVDLDSNIIQFLKQLESNSEYNLKVIQADITKPIQGVSDKSVDVVLASEILEHLEYPEMAIKEAMRIAKQYIIITVPSKPDDNPEHIQYFTLEDIKKLFDEYNISSINIHPNAKYNLFMVTI